MWEKPQTEIFIFIFLSSWWWLVVVLFIARTAQSEASLSSLASCRNEWIKHASLALLGGFVCVRAAHPLVRSFVPCSVSLISGWRYRLGEFAWTCAFFTAIVFISSAYPAECTSLRVNEFCWLSDKNEERFSLFFLQLKNTYSLTPRCKVSFRLWSNSLLPTYLTTKLHLGFCCCCTLLCTVSYCDINNHFWRYLFTPAHHFPLDLPSIKGDQLGNLLHTMPCYIH